MIVGIISDSHDHLPNLRQAMADLQNRGASAIIHCGDLSAPFVTKELGAFAGPVHTVFGNNDADRFLAQKLAPENVHHHGEFGFIELDGKRLGFTLYAEYARGFAASGQCDAAFYGHSHEHAHELVADCLALNPGELLGMKGPPAFCTYDTQTDRFEHIIFPHQRW